MFANLSKGNIIHGLDRQNIKLFVATVERVVPTYARTQNTFGQIPEPRVDIVTTINGKQQEFKQVPSNTAFADFGENACLIADNKESLYNGIKELLRKSQNIVESAPYHESLIPQYKEAMDELIPGSITGNEEVKSLKEEVGSLKAQLAEAIALLKNGNNNINDKKQN